MQSKKFQTNFQINELPINKIICGDCLEKMQEYLPDGCIDLICLDPPFFSGRKHEAIWADGSEMRSFEDTNWYQRICTRCGFTLSTSFLFCPRCGKSTAEFKRVRRSDIQSYINWLEPRLRECHRVLQLTGSIYVHLDWHAAHYVKVLMDKIFGYNNFRNEIIWHYGLGGSSSKYYSRKHDTILFYSKGDKYYFNPPKVPATSNRLKGQFKKLDDVWEIPAINNMAKERLGYPTQKPLKLLQRIIATSSRKGDIVLDPFAGCSTTLVAAHQLGRQWIGIDISPTSCRISCQRLIKSGARMSFNDSIDLPTTEDELRDLEEVELQNWIAEKLNLHSRIDRPGGFTLEGIPVWITKKCPSRTEIRQFANSYRQGIIYTFDFKESALDEIKQLKMNHSISIELRSIAQELIE